MWLLVLAHNLEHSPWASVDVIESFDEHPRSCYHDMCKLVAELPDEKCVELMMPEREVVIPMRR